MHNTQSLKIYSYYNKLATNDNLMDKQNNSGITIRIIKFSSQKIYFFFFLRNILKNIFITKIDASLEKFHFKNNRNNRNNNSINLDKRSICVMKNSMYKIRFQTNNYKKTVNAIILEFKWHDFSNSFSIKIMLWLWIRKLSEKNYVTQS